ncbi:hypothetical protein SASPL_124238 [Salvia splendens]|uniref:AAA+ ATPase domain-containing protein n=1 Tax=Salvia splendens TaxID=180675 RepID=A0A8X8XN50_SALSN|nr:hypothetical protein SASPL_124238 [Salvia splendens]
MGVSRLPSLAAAAAVAASYIAAYNRAYADSPFRFYPFSSSSSSEPEGPPKDSSGQGEDSQPAPAVEVSKSSFDPEALERGAKALREINSSPHAKQVFEVTRRQEQTRLAELDAEKANIEAIQAHDDIEKQRKWAEEQRNLYQQQAQGKAQMMRYEDELTRKRMQTDNEALRRHNAELVQMQEESSLRKEQARRATEEQIQAQQRQTEKERAEIERETIRVKAMAEAEGRAHEAKLTEDHNRRMLLERVNGERDKWLAAINTTFSHIEGGLRVLLTDRSRLVMTVGGATALAAGVYTTREGARVMWGYVNRILGQPSLIRESSLAKYPWSGVGSRVANKVLSYSTAAGAAATQRKSALGDVVLHPSLQKRIEHLARATSNTKINQAPFRNMLFYGPPGTGKTMVAREIARKSGLDYAMMTGGDVAPLGPQAVTKIHEIFDWAKKSKRGLLLFIDEADAFLCERNNTYMSEAQRSALNALLFRTGDQSRDIVLVLATNRPGDLDSAVTDRIDEVIEFPIPREDERFKLLKLYLTQYLCGEGDKDSRWGSFIKNTPQKITVKDISDDVYEKLPEGRKASQAVVDYKVAEHHQRIKLAAEA